MCVLLVVGMDYSASEQRKDMLHLIAQYRRLSKATKTFREGKSTDTYNAMREAEETTENMVNEYYKKYRLT